MSVETVEDIVEQMADLIGVYGGCHCIDGSPDDAKRHSRISNHRGISIGLRYTGGAVRYGKPPSSCGEFAIHLPEYMYYLYLPVVMDGVGLRLPRSLDVTRGLIATAMDLTKRNYRYVYLSARRGYASPDNPLNRPGWHADGFGTDDLNYAWSNRFPTRFAIQEFCNISPDDATSVRQFEQQIDLDKVVEGRPNALYRLDPYVVHATPLVPAPGGERQFIKVSFSDARYNLEGNSHNWLFEYDWHGYRRDEVRNSPIANADYVA